jgi:hypothetical protein
MAWLKKLANGNASRICAAIIGSLLATVVLTIGITMLWPLGDTIEKVFAGGVFFFVIWAGLFYWAILSQSGGRAWLKVLGVFLPMLLIDVYLLRF